MVTQNSLRTLKVKTPPEKRKDMARRRCDLIVEFNHATSRDRPTRRRLWSRGCNGFASNGSCPASPAAFGAGSCRRLQPRSAVRAQAHDAHPFCQDEKTRLPAEMLRLDSRTICFLEFEPPDFCSSFRPSSAMNRLRKAASKSDSKSSHWGRFPMGRLFASASTYT